MATIAFTALAVVVATAYAHDSLPVNPILGEGGYPNCVQSLPPSKLSNNVEENIKTISCAQKEKDFDGQISIACVGDSITAGVHSSGGNHTYPAQLQIMLNAEYPNKYKVTNLGACGSTMMKSADSPFWKRPQYKALVASKWDIVIVMLGTNDAKDPGSGHRNPNWPHNCTGPNALECPYAEDYASMISLLSTLGTSPSGPKIFTAIPPPLMQQGAYGMNQTVINSVFPVLIPQINAANKVDTTPIDVFTALGGVKDWASTYPKMCTLQTANQAKCPLFCDQQSCDQCHPDDNGYVVMAKTMKAGLGL